MFKLILMLSAFLWSALLDAGSGGGGGGESGGSGEGGMPEHRKTQSPAG